MPKKRQTRRRSRRWVGVLFVMLLVAAGLVVYAVGKEIRDSDGKCAEGDTSCEEKQAEADSDDDDDKGGSGCSLCNKDEPKNGSTIESEKDIVQQETPTGDTLGMWVTSKNIVNGTLQIRVQIDQVISSGTCSIEIGDYSASAAVVSEPQGASCEGFDVPTKSYSGDSYTITVKSGDKSGSVTGAIDG